MTDDVMELLVRHGDDFKAIPGVTMVDSGPVSPMILIGVSSEEAKIAVLGSDIYKQFIKEVKISVVII